MDKERTCMIKRLYFTDSYGIWIFIKKLTEAGKGVAPYLAEKFQVSRRTMNRHIEDLCKADIRLLDK